MLYLTYAPEPPLSEFVDYFWLFDGGHTPRKERIVPSGTTELVINLRDDEIRVHHPAQSNQPRRFSGAVMSGPYSSILVVDAMQHESMLGVHFKPGGAFPFSAALASDLTNAHADLTDLWGRGGLELRERLCVVKTHQERFQIVEEVLTERLRRSREGHLAVANALTLFGPYGTRASVRDVAREVGMSQRRFRTVFAAQLASNQRCFAASCDFSESRLWQSESRNLIGPG